MESRSYYDILAKTHGSVVNNTTIPGEEMRHILSSSPEGDPQCVKDRMAMRGEQAFQDEFERPKIEPVTVFQN